MGGGLSVFRFLEVVQKCLLLGAVGRGGGRQPRRANFFWLGGQIGVKNESNKIKEIMQGVGN